MPSIFDFPDVYDAVLRSSPEQIETEVNSIQNLLGEKGVSNGRALELACGTCAHGILLAKSGFSVTGIDINPNMLEGAQSRIETAGVETEIIQGDVVNFNVDDAGFDCAIFMAETFPLITAYADIKSHFQSVRRHVKNGGLYIIDMDKHNFAPPKSDIGIWGGKTVPLDNGYVTVWHEDFPGDWVDGVNRMAMHCRVHVDDTCFETTNDWSLRYYNPWILSLLAKTLEGWNLTGFFSRGNLSQKIAEEAHYFTVMEKVS